MQRRNSLYALITAIGLMAWVAAGSYLFSENCCGTSVDSYNGALGGTMLIEDGNAFRLETQKTILFPENSAKPILYQEVSEQLMEVVRYVKSNPIKKVTIRGLFTENESGGAQLGRERAEAIRQQLFVNSETPAYQIAVEAGLRKNLLVDVDNKMVFGAIEFLFTCMAPFKVEDIATKFKIEADNNFVFNYASVDFLLSLPPAMEDVLKQLVAYLKENPQRQLILTGYNHPDEGNGTVFENLGWARANKMRSLLVQLGADARQVAIKGVADERLAVFNSALYNKFLPNAMGFELDVLQPTRAKQYDRKYAKIEKELKEMQVFRFKDFGQKTNKIIMNDKLKAYMNDLILYISMNKKAKIYCVGHSNPSKTKEESAVNGSQRAEYVRGFLKKHGILEDRIETTTAGDSHPLGEENTKYGQQINRRVDLFISYDGSQPKLYALPPLETEKKKNLVKKTKKKNSVDSVAKRTINTPKIDSLK
ncbi:MULTISPECIES: OmpA family protein [unclassified Aureispira]|uniref:OmpA family protein n=1 Tax=unclassified Aureispira TaxID=2649989 RepID=UPI000697E718|nr:MULTISPECIES: OmpA family protein [unclassified Aureispira]WMX12855.1 OmpA family protein [Aureispira sp. CCB-E]